MCTILFKSTFWKQTTGYCFLYNFYWFMFVSDCHSLTKNIAMRTYSVENIGSDFYLWSFHFMPLTSIITEEFEWPYVFCMITRQFGGSYKKCSLQPEVQTCWLWTSVRTCYRGKDGLCTNSVKGMIFVLFVMWMHISCPSPKESENEWGSQISVTVFSQSGSNMKVYHSYTVIWTC